ncbi:hypothetical protein V3C99_006140, partial [Haemonchus contortus]
AATSTTTEAATCTTPEAATSTTPEAATCTTPEPPPRLQSRHLHDPHNSTAPEFRRF